jgi:ligand-binding sensor domain-containing protein/two-component sensor histidine kinase
MRRKLPIIFLYLFCTGLFLTSAAQKRSYFLEKLSVNEGLSSNTITDLIQDDNGFLWVATSEGLNRFDGTEVVQYFSQDKSNRLPHNFIYCLKKLPGNYIAIGTQAGLCIYDGNDGSFRTIYYTQNQKFDEYNNIIIELELDARGNLWAASTNCIYVFDPHLILKKVFTSPFTDVDFMHRRIRYSYKIIPFSDGSMLISLYDGWYIGSADSNRVTRLEQSSLKQKFDFVLEMTTRTNGERYESFFPSAHLFKIFDKYLLCIKSNQDTLLLMDESGHRMGSCYFPYNHYPNILWSQRVGVLDSGHVAFLFHNTGLAIIPIIWSHGLPSIGTPSPVLFGSSSYDAALGDRQGNWWLVTSNEGLQKISPSKQVFNNEMLISVAPVNQANRETTSISRYGNSLWICTYGEGFFRVDLKTGKQQQFLLQKTGNDLWANFIWNIRQISPDSLWVGTQAGLFWFVISSKKQGHLAAYPGKPAVLDTVPITTQFDDGHGLIWMGLGRGNGLCYFDKMNRRFAYFPAKSMAYPLRYPLSIAEAPNGDLWFTNDASNLLVSWSRKTNSFHVISWPAAMKNQLSHLYAIYFENDSICWLGSVTNGLIRFNISNNKMDTYGHDRGLINSHIRSIWQDMTKRLWLNTDGGLSCFDPSTETFFNCSENEGLPVRYPTASLYYDSLDHWLYSGGLGNYFYFDPNTINNNRIPQKPIITALQVNGEPFAFKDQKLLAFSSQQNDITVHYTAVDLIAGPKTTYAYKLSGEDEDTGWIKAGHQRQINFSHLAPGKYQLLVRSQNMQGIQNNQEALIRFFIRPSFIQTAWFYVLIFIAIAGLFYGLYRFRLRQLVRTEQIRNEISKNLHDEVGSTLTNISLGSLLAQKQLHEDSQVSRILERIYQDSQTVSQTMREIVWSINPKIDTLGEALPRMIQYASELLEAKNILLKAEISPHLDRIKLTMEERRDLYLIFKESVNNLARHSVASKANIRFRVESGLLEMVIADDGKGFDKAVSISGNGLKNIRERAQRHKWQLIIQSSPGSGSILTIKADIA